MRGIKLELCCESDDFRLVFYKKEEQGIRFQEFCLSIDDLAGVVSSAREFLKGFLGLNKLEDKNDE
jgi:hypothetical protein